ncbi:MAG: flagellar basal body L-ring protein FlgH [Bryobacteraceae bacterium]
MRAWVLTGMLAAALMPAGLMAAEKGPSAIDRYIEQARSADAAAVFSPGSLYTATARLGDLGRDLRSMQVDDLVTVLVSDRASALAKGTTTSNRKSSAKATTGALLGKLPVSNPLANLAQFDGQQQIQGQGETSRQTVLTTTLAARVTHVLPNGYLVLEGAKDIQVNSERQLVTVRGVARWNDVGLDNTISSDRLAQLEVRVQGKGVVGDAIRRPNLLYRILMGILPF